MHEFGSTERGNTNSGASNELVFTVSQFLELANVTLDYAYPSVTIEGEVSSYKVNQGKWVFFDLKDEEANINCFMPLWDLRTPIEDGMKIRIVGSPKITKWGKFSFTVRNIMPVGKGSIKKAFELLKEKLTKEGLFDPLKKRKIDIDKIGSIGVISSTQAAGYADFIKIVNERWGGLKIKVCHTGVQGLSAADQIIKALNYLNEKSEVDVITIIRGGGSADDLAVFNDEKLVRAIAASKIPVVTGIGHEVDESLADLAADLAASTPSNAAQFLTKDRHAEIRNINGKVQNVRQKILTDINALSVQNLNQIENLKRQVFAKINAEITKIQNTKKTLERLNPDLILKQGYAILRGKLAPGSAINIETYDKNISATITQVKERE